MFRYHWYARIHLICQNDHESQVQLDLESKLWQSLSGLWHPKSTESCAFVRLQKTKLTLSFTAYFSTLRSAVTLLLSVQSCAQGCV